MPRSLVLLIALLIPNAAALAQVPAAPDTTRRDTTGVTHLPEIEVSVTRTSEPLARVPNAVSVLDRGDLQRAQLTVGLDEAFNNLAAEVFAEYDAEESRHAND